VTLREKVRHCEQRYRADEERQLTDEERRRADEKTIHFLQCQLEDRLMRMRFLSTFKRDHLPGEYDITHADRECIEVGNRLAYGANPVRDADFYLQGQCTDLNTFKALYGLDPLSVRRLSESSQYPVGS